jgi:hypothetical protein
MSMSPILRKALYVLAVLLLTVATVFQLRADSKAIAQQADSIKQLKADKRDLEGSIKDLKDKQVEVQAIDTARVQSAERIRTITKEVLHEVPVYLPAADAAVLLPPGWRVLHDAAAQGSQAASAASATGGPDAAPITAEAAAVTVVENYGTCLDTADRLAKLQDYVTQVVLAP